MWRAEKKSFDFSARETIINTHVISAFKFVISTFTTFTIILTFTFVKNLNNLYTHPNIYI